MFGVNCPLYVYRYMPSLFTCSKSTHVNWPTSQKTSAHKVFGLIKGWKFKIKKVLRMINVYTKNTNTIFLCWMFLSKSITILISISHEILITLYFSNAKSKQKSSKTTNKIQRSWSTSNNIMHQWWLFGKGNQNTLRLLIHAITIFTVFCKPFLWAH